MTNVTISVSDELKRRLERYPEINWSEVTRQAWEEKMQQLELFNKLTAKSRATDKDVEELAALIKKGMARRHREEKPISVPEVALLSSEERLKLLNELTAGSKATDKDIEELSDLIKRGMTKRIDEDITKLRAKK